MISSSSSSISCIELFLSTNNLLLAAYRSRSYTMMSPVEYVRVLLSGCWFCLTISCFSSSIWYLFLVLDCGRFGAVYCSAFGFCVILATYYFKLALSRFSWIRGPLSYDRFILSFNSGLALVFFRCDAFKFGAFWYACSSIWLSPPYEASNMWEIILIFPLSRASTGLNFFNNSASAWTLLEGRFPSMPSPE